MSIQNDYHAYVITYITNYILQLFVLLVYLLPTGIGIPWSTLFFSCRKATVSTNQISTYFLLDIFIYFNSHPSK